METNLSKTAPPSQKVNLDLGFIWIHYAAAPLVELAELEVFGTAPPSFLFHFHMGPTC